MSTQLSNLVDVVRAAVARSDGLAACHLAGQVGAFDTAPLPAATLTLDRYERPGRDDFLDGLARVRFDATLWRRDGNRAANAAALATLGDAAVTALLSDTDLAAVVIPGSAGEAVEILAVAPGRQQSPPLGSLTVSFSCRILPADALTPLPDERQVRIDGEQLLASGPHVLSVSAPSRRRIDRAFAGLDGGVLIDLGTGPRTLTLAGRLVGISAADLLVQVADLEAINDGTTHTLTAPDGRSFADCVVDELTFGRVLSTGPDATSAAGFRMTLAGLGA